MLTEVTAVGNRVEGTILEILLIERKLRDDKAKASKGLLCGSTPDESGWEEGMLSRQSSLLALTKLHLGPQEMTCTLHTGVYHGRRGWMSSLHSSPAPCQSR